MITGCFDALRNPNMSLEPVGSTPSRKRSLSKSIFKGGVSFRAEMTLIYPDLNEEVDVRPCLYY